METKKESKVWEEAAPRGTIDCVYAGAATPRACRNEGENLTHADRITIGGHKREMPMKSMGASTGVRM
jgi:hypothetical protein